jgi:DNA-binding MarR family transcriptional regulator
MMAKNSDFEQLFNTVLQFGKLMSRQTQEDHEEKTATMLQYMALHFLKEQPSGTVGDLADFLKLSKSSATQLIERLVEANLVERINDKKDRRIIRLVITENGEREFIVLKKKLMEKMQKIFSKIPAKDLKEFIRIFKNLIEKLKNE